MKRYTLYLVFEDRSRYIYKFTAASEEAKEIMIDMLCARFSNPTVTAIECHESSDQSGC